MISSLKFVFRGVRGVETAIRGDPVADPHERPRPDLHHLGKVLAARGRPQGRFTFPTPTTAAAAASPPASVPVG